jgi:Na+-translocating ferredoxin:NAD+ oxidoreductase RnfA subunit
MPVLAATLLWLNSRRDLVGSLRNGWAASGTLALALLLFALIAARQVVDLL